MQFNRHYGLLALSLKISDVQHFIPDKTSKTFFMKTKLFLSLLAALFFSQAMMAQFHIGIKGGANVSKIEGKGFKDDASKP